MLNVNIKVIGENVPFYETVGSAGMDLKANISESVILKPMERTLIGTGLFFEIPKGYEAQIRARSGLAIKHGICLINGVGTIDSDYRGEVKIALVNLGNENFEIKNGERIAQVVFAKYEQVEWNIVEELNDTERGEGGFGHTGK